MWTIPQDYYRATATATVPMTSALALYRLSAIVPFICKQSACWQDIYQDRWQAMVKAEYDRRVRDPTEFRVPVLFRGISFAQ